MKRVLVILATLLVLAAAAPAVVADDGTGEGRTLIAINGDTSLPVGEEAEAVIVIGGDALVEGTARTIFVIDGVATLRGSTVESLTVINGRAVLEAGTTITGDVAQLNSVIDRADGVAIGGSLRSLAETFAAFGLFLGAAALLIWLGVALATLVAGFALAAFGARQVRATEAIISAEPLKTFLVGLAMIIVPPLVVALLALTVVGLPLALSVLLFVWPTLAFIGYLVAAIWIGDWLLRSTGRRSEAQRPYLAAFVGLLAAALLGLIPIISAVISIFGLGAVVIAAWRTLTGGQVAQPSFQPSPSPAAA